MIDRVDHCFFDGFIGEVGHTGRFGAVTLFDHGFAQVVAADIVKHFAYDAGDWPLKNFFGKFVTARAIGKPDDIDLRDRKEAVRLAVKKE